MGKKKDTTPTPDDENTNQTAGNAPAEGSSQPATDPSTEGGNSQQTVTPSNEEGNANQTAGNAPAEGFSQPAANPSTEDDNSQPEEVKPVVMQVTSDRGLRLRKGPSLDFDIVAILPKGTCVTVIDLPVVIPGWLCVAAGEDTGFVMLSFLAEVQE